jgi:hypothetical protein
VNHRTTTTILAVLTAALVVAGTALAATAGPAKTFVFKATYKGTATTKVTDNVADILANGAGTGSFIGAGKITGVGKGDTSQQPCVPFTGPGKMTGTTGTISFKVLTASKGCGNEDGTVFSLSGKAAVISATGKLAKTKGTLKFTGTYTRSGDGGDFNVTFKGTLTR